MGSVDAWIERYSPLDPLSRLKGIETFVYSASNEFGCGSTLDPLSRLKGIETGVNDVHYGKT